MYHVVGPNFVVHVVIPHPLTHLQLRTPKGPSISIADTEGPKIGYRNRFGPCIYPECCRHPQSGLRDFVWDRVLIPVNRLPKIPDQQQGDQPKGQMISRLYMNLVSDCRLSLDQRAEGHTQRILRGVAKDRPKYFKISHISSQRHSLCSVEPTWKP